MTRDGDRPSSVTDATVRLIDRQYRRSSLQGGRLSKLALTSPLARDGQNRVAGSSWANTDGRRFEGRGTLGDVESRWHSVRGASATHIGPPGRPLFHVKQPSYLVEHISSSSGRSPRGEPMRSVPGLHLVCARVHTIPHARLDARSDWSWLYTAVPCCFEAPIRGMRPTVGMSKEPEHPPQATSLHPLRARRLRGCRPETR